jgi:putative proteasome-type protease
MDAGGVEVAFVRVNATSEPSASECPPQVCGFDFGIRPASAYNRLFPAIRLDAMTYCLAINVNEGLVLCSDSRTNAGTDNVSVYSKMFIFSWPGARFLTLLSAGNLATTQAVVKKLQGDIPAGMVPNLTTVASMQEAADYIGMVSTQVQRLHGARDTASTNFEATFILAGQISGQPTEIFMVYPQGNYIHESPEHPFLQIGEFKYGKPILDRVIKREVVLERAARCALVSMNSTVRSNVTVGPPIELLIYKRDALDEGKRIVFREDDPFAAQLSERWNEGLLIALQNLPRFDWEDDDEGGDEGDDGRVLSFPSAS